MNDKGKWHLSIIGELTHFHAINVSAFTCITQSIVKGYTFQMMYLCNRYQVLRINKL